MNKWNSIEEKAREYHKQCRGKIEISTKVKHLNRETLSIVYTPGVAAVSQAIFKKKDNVYKYTLKSNSIAIITDGSAVLGLGNIGPYAALPVMEGKAVLFKELANIDAFPICLKEQNTEKIIRTIEAISPSFGGINLEDISAPRCFQIERALKKSLDIPVFHDDQHGTAIVVLAAIENALKIVHKKKEEIRIVINGAGAAGLAIADLLLYSGYKNIILCDRNGIIHNGRKEGMNAEKERIALITNKQIKKGNLSHAMRGADVFIGVSTGKIVSKEMITSMAKDPIVLAMANPIPEIMPQEAMNAGAVVVGTGRSDFPNQVNNVLAFPGVFRGALDAPARDINRSMMIAAAKALASLVTPKSLSKGVILPDVLNKNVVPCVSRAVKETAQKTGVLRTCE